ncbi:uncharacterized protein TRIADDRAFT_52356 [Trichoplax adhaerens]|uniref:MYND-type domain-containing protein n=1 Tax=Trichoplax adhaerens TaxID=10228 RepID=B3RI25_TRIAD|nr:hypothetical protein TRIADDRAFT_52356 [Trichoplax adhaerens]EDV28961.1 hypothetical protein TRIADDRAFT_52356 [Trichoplax adhaerens]|eukprot:XP_002108163.1 hypothetical protein TRIADDRAFT_52356 [Trichoplax adhaerens]
MDLNENEKSLIQAVSKGDEGIVRQLLCESNVSIDCCDETGMTPLMHAAYKGNANFCDLLIKNGANVNCNNHEYQYTPLMFAALAGSVETAKVLLEAGASTKATNKVNRTASQLGAFVGQHHVVSFINSFVPFEELEYFTKPHGLETEPKLPPLMARIFHKLLLNSNMNPCRIVIFLMDNKDLVDNWEIAVSMLELLCERSMKAQETNEIMSMRMHYFSYIIKAVVKHEDGPMAFLKHLLKGSEPNGVQIRMEQFIRQAIRSFPYHESTLFVQLVRNIAPVKLGDDPSSLSVLTTGINGHQSADFSDCCYTCGEKRANMKCSACKKVKYCDQRCQKFHWFTHKKFCKYFAEEFLREQKLQEAEENISQSANTCISEANISGETSDPKSEQ